MDSLYCCPLPASPQLPWQQVCQPRYSSAVSTTAIYRGKFTALPRWKQRNPSPLLHHPQTQKLWGCLALPTAPSGTSGPASLLWHRLLPLPAPRSPPVPGRGDRLPEPTRVPLPTPRRRSPPAAPARRQPDTSTVLVTTEPPLPPLPSHGEHPRDAKEQMATHSLSKKKNKKITFFPPWPHAAASHQGWACPGLPLAGALALCSSGFPAEAAETKPQPRSKGLTLPGSSSAADPHCQSPGRGLPELLPSPVPLSSHLPSPH